MVPEVGCQNLLLDCSLLVSQIEGEGAEALAVAVALLPLEGSV